MQNLLVCSKAALPNSLIAKKRTTPDGVVLFWRSERDLNPRAAFDRLLP